MTLNDEASVKKVLGISTFRQMSKEKMLAFAAMVPDMASDVRIKLIEQIPGFLNFAHEAVDAAEHTFEKTVDANSESMNQLHDAFADIRQGIKDQLARDDLTPEQRQLLTDQLIAQGEAQSGKDSENKEFLASEADKTRGTILKVAAVSVVAAVVLAGGKVMLDQLGSDDAGAGGHDDGGDRWTT